ncbi:hypothetical protein ACFL12_03720 [Pseudomonadota bacterium]
MAKKYVIKELLAKIGLVEEPQADAKQADTLAKEPGAASAFLNKSRELQVFTQRLDRVLEQHADVGGHLFLLDFTSVKAKLGAKWETSSEQIHKSINAIIEKNLSPHDIQFQKDDETYLILLPTLGVQEGQLKSSIIAEEVADTLVGEEKVANLFKVQTVTTSANGDLVSEDTPPISNLLERVSERLSAMPEKKAGTETPQAPSSSSGVPGALEAAKMEIKTNADVLAALEEFHFVFRPLLSVKTKIISTFLCIPVREVVPGHFASGYQVLGPGASPAELYALDIACVNRVASELWGLSTEKKRSLLALPVHFETLADQKKRMAYVKLCRDKFQELTPRIIFEITGLPEGVPQPRLLEFVSALRPVSRAVIARFSADHKAFPAFRAAGLHAVGIDIYDNTVGETLLMKQMDTFVQNARQMQLKSYVEGVRSLSMFTASITSGFDYIAGYALSGVVDSADDIKEFKLDSLYMSMLQDLGRLPRD